MDAILINVSMAEGIACTYLLSPLAGGSSVSVDGLVGTFAWLASQDLDLTASFISFMLIRYPVAAQPGRLG